MNGGARGIRFFARLARVSVRALIVFGVIGAVSASTASAGQIEFHCNNLPVNYSCAENYTNTTFYGLQAYSDSGDASVTDWLEPSGLPDALSQNWGVACPVCDITGVGLYYYGEASADYPEITNSGRSTQSFTVYAEFSGSLGGIG